MSPGSFLGWGAKAGWRQQHHTRLFKAAPAGGGPSVCLSFVTVPRAAAVETAGPAGAVVVTATASTGETARVAREGPALLGTVVAAMAASGRTATTGAEVTSTGAREARSGGVLVAHSAHSVGHTGPGPFPGHLAGHVCPQHSRPHLGTDTGGGGRPPDQDPH